MYTLDVITFGVITARGMVKRTRRGQRMNAIPPRVAKLRSRHNTQTESAVKR